MLGCLFYSHGVNFSVHRPQFDGVNFCNISIGRGSFVLALMYLGLACFWISIATNFNRLVILPELFAGVDSGCYWPGLTDQTYPESVAGWTEPGCQVRSDWCWQIIYWLMNDWTKKATDLLNNHLALIGLFMTSKSATMTMPHQCRGDCSWHSLFPQHKNSVHWDSNGRWTGHGHSASFCT